MKKSYRVHTGTKVIEREYSYIPVRYIVAVMITVFEVVAVIASVAACCYFIPYFYLAAWVTEIVCVVRIIASDDNPDYKVPWLLFVLILPIAGFMLYFLFYSRKLQKRFIRRLDEMKCYRYEKNGEAAMAVLEKESSMAASQARMLCRIAGCSVFMNTKATYYPLGEDMMADMLRDLDRAERFILMEYFIIEEGKFWNAILGILEKKAKAGVTVRVLYDDIGCMTTLPGDYAKKLGGLGIEALPFSRLRGAADSEFNNRSHRKILVIDGKVGYTGGINLADEYINEIERFGHWKDTAIRLEGEAVRELTRLFLCDFGINAKKLPKPIEGLYPDLSGIKAEGFVIPFGDGPNPIYERRVGKSVIQNILNGAQRYVYLTTPYLILDNELASTIENTAMRGVDVRIFVPHIPDKKLVFQITKSFYQRFVKAGVRIYEYLPGFLHAKSCIADGEYAMIGTINLDYRSLVHHFENAVWLYRSPVIGDMEKDFKWLLSQSAEIGEKDLKTGLFARMLRAIVRIFAPML